MTNLLNLPQFPPGTVINLQNDADWNDQFFVPKPGFPATPIVLVGALAGNETFTVQPGNVLPGMITQGYGVTSGTTVSAVDSGAITLSDAASITAPGATLTFFPPPLDLTGISFASTLRVGRRASEVILSLSSAQGTMTNGGAGGQFGWLVTAAQMRRAPWPAALAVQGTLACVMDVIATDATGGRRNLCELNGPITVEVSLSITR